MYLYQHIENDKIWWSGVWHCKPEELFSEVSAGATAGRKKIMQNTWQN